MPPVFAKKPKKPDAEFPLTAHGNWQWCKKIRGKVHVFGVWANPDAALAKYLDEPDDLQAGHIPLRLTGDREYCRLARHHAKRDKLSQRREVCQKCPQAQATTF